MTKTFSRRLGRGLAVVAAALWLAFPAHADVGQIKVATGQVFVDRKGQSLPGRVGLVLEADDVLRTGADGSVGITMRDNSLLSAGPNSILAWSASSSTPRPARAASTPSLRRGTLAVVSGRIAKKSPQAMTVRTPSAVLGVRGTEFVVAVDD